MRLWRAARSVSFKELDRALMLLRGGARSKRAQIAPFVGLGVEFARVESILAGGELANHDVSRVKRPVG